MSRTREDWSSLLQHPRSVDEFTSGKWFECLANSLLNKSKLIVNELPHRIVEIEFYYHSPKHPDPFAHRGPLQRERGRWCFHRTGRTHQSYRGGSFKGLDLTFGDGIAFAGILLRSVERPDGELINGPSLLVDYLLNVTEQQSVAALDDLINTRQVWDSSSPISMLPVEDRRQPVTWTSRVGLSLKRVAPSEANLSFLVRRYRYLTERKRISKGKRQTILALHADGLTIDEISRETGTRVASIQRILSVYSMDWARLYRGPQKPTA